MGVTHALLDWFRDEMTVLLDKARGALGLGVVLLLSDALFTRGLLELEILQLGMEDVLFSLTELKLLFR